MRFAVDEMANRILFCCVFLTWSISQPDTEITINRTR